MTKLLTYAIQNGKLKSIDEVPNGEECNCICPKCGEKLIAKGNDNNRQYIRKAHFAHYYKNECPGSYESALHLLAKEVFEETKALRIPDYHFDYNPLNKNSKFRKFDKIFFFEEVFVEIVDGEFENRVVFDARAIIKEQIYNIEFANTHFVDNTKKEKIKNLNSLCIEVNLKDLNLDKEEIKNFFLGKSKNIYWIYNKQLEIEYKNYKNILEYIEKEKIERFELNYDIENINNLISFNTYILKGYRYYRIENNKTNSCPLVNERIINFRNNIFFKNKVLRRIFEGEFWDKKIVGKNSEGYKIYFDNKWYYLGYPDNSNEYDQENFTIMYNGLIEILDFDKIDISRKCKRCKYFHSVFSLKNEEYILCKNSSKFQSKDILKI